jgi:hypothetical protein
MRKLKLHLMQPLRYSYAEELPEEATEWLVLPPGSPHGFAVADAAGELALGPGDYEFLQLSEPAQRRHAIEALGGDGVYERHILEDGRHSVQFLAPAPAK